MWKDSKYFSNKGGERQVCDWGNKQHGHWEQFKEFDAWIEYLEAFC